jgi:hypothetical protein
MAKLRSPNYPQETLQQAIQRIERVYKEEHTHPAPKEVIAKALGYNSINGASLAVLGTLRRYALLIQDGENLRVSDDAVTILELEEGDPERGEALYRCAFAPKLFEEMRDKFGDKLPSDTNLRHFLIQQKKFLPKAADGIIRVYRANLELVTPEDGDYNADGAAEERAPEGRSPMPPAIQQAATPATPQGRGAFTSASQPNSPPPGMHFPLYLSKDKQGALYVPFAMTTKEWELLKRQVDHSLGIAEATALIEDEPPPASPAPQNEAEE